MVSQQETDRRLYYDLIEYAAHRGDMMLAADILAYGEPPYADIPYAYGFVMGYYDALYKPYTPPQAYLERGEGAGHAPAFEYFEAFHEIMTGTILPETYGH